MHCFSHNSLLGWLILLLGRTFFEFLLHPASLLELLTKLFPWASHQMLGHPQAGLVQLLTLTMVPAMMTVMMMMMMMLEAFLGLAGSRSLGLLSSARRIVGGSSRRFRRWFCHCFDPVVDLEEFDPVVSRLVQLALQERFVAEGRGQRLPDLEEDVTVWVALVDPGLTNLAHVIVMTVAIDTAGNTDIQHVYV